MQNIGYYMCRPISLHSGVSLVRNLGESWIRVNKISIFQANFREISIVSGNFTKSSIFPGKFYKNLIISGKFLKNFEFLRQFLKQFLFSMEKLLIYSYFR